MNWRTILFGILALCIVVFLFSYSPTRHIRNRRRFEELLGIIAARRNRRAASGSALASAGRRAGFISQAPIFANRRLLAGRIDTYVEYTGTALTAILHDPLERNFRRRLRRVQSEYQQRFGLEVLPSLGFNNTFAIVVRGEDARRLNLKTISDAAPYTPKWRAGFGYEFMERPDGYKGLAQTYGLSFAGAPRILDLGLLYRALLDKQVDIVAGNSTDGLLSARDLVMLEDNKHYFPPYEAVPIVRTDALARYPRTRTALTELSNKISDAEMRKMNYEVDGEHRDISEVAHEFLHAKGLD